MERVERRRRVTAEEIILSEGWDFCTVTGDEHSFVLEHAYRFPIEN